MLKKTLSPPLPFVTGWRICTGQSLNSSLWKYNQSQDGRLLYDLHSPLHTQGLLDVCFNASEENIETLTTPIKANATSCRKEQCKS